MSHFIPHYFFFPFLCLADSKATTPVLSFMVWMLLNSSKQLGLSESHARCLVANYAVVAAELTLTNHLQKAKTALERALGTYTVKLAILLWLCNNAPVGINLLKLQAILLLQKDLSCLSRPPVSGFKYARMRSH